MPESYRSGALGMGATKWYMIRTILLPSAMPGIITGIILAVGRIVGESAALLFTAGSGYYLPKNLLSKIFESGGTLTIQLYLFMQKAKYNEAFGVALVLLVIVLGINGLAKIHVPPVQCGSRGIGWGGPFQLAKERKRGKQNKDFNPEPEPVLRGESCP